MSIGIKIFYLYLFFFFLFLIILPYHPDVEWFLLLFICLGHPVFVIDIFFSSNQTGFWLPSLFFWIFLFILLKSFFRELKEQNRNEKNH
jgi:hypothetical protein